MDTYLPGHPNTQGIRFNDCFFSEPAPLAGWVRPKCAGLFGVLVSDPNWAPRPFQPLYFGEFGNNASDTDARSNYDALLTAANGRALLVCVYPMPFSTSAQRWALRHELVLAYNPMCQRSAGQSANQEQQGDGLRWTPEAPKEPRRRIGFMPQVDEPAA
jgi:hypothetical protein